MPVCRRQKGIGLNQTGCQCNA